MQHARLHSLPPPLTAVRCRCAALLPLSAVTIRTRRRVRSSLAFPTSVSVIDATTLLSGEKNSESINQSRTSQNGEREQQQDDTVRDRRPPSLPCARCTSRVITLRPAAMRGSIGLLQRRVAATCDGCHSSTSALRIHRSRIRVVALPFPSLRCLCRRSAPAAVRRRFAALTICGARTARRVQTRAPSVCRTETSSRRQNKMDAQSAAARQMASAMRSATLQRPSTSLGFQRCLVVVASLLRGMSLMCRCSVFPFVLCPCSARRLP